MTEQSTVGWFRTRPPAPGDHAILRLRLLDILRTRFDRPLTVVMGSAGHGKTTLMAQAMAENAFDPQGTDVWLCCNDRDRAPDHFLAGLAASLTGDVAAPLAGASASVDDIIDLLVLRSPHSVALVLDDLHVVDGSPTVGVVRDLLDRLPRNAHLVIASRTLPAVGVRLHQSRGTAVVIDQTQLQFTADERSQVADVIGHDGHPDLLPAWPALAVLTSRLGTQAGAEYVWDAVLAELSPERRSAVAKLSLFPTVDEALARAVLGDDTSVHEVVMGLPLVDQLGDEVRLHDLWRVALAQELDADAARTTHRRAARHLEDCGDLLRAAHHYRDAREPAEVERIARIIAALPVAGGLDRNAAEAIHGLLPPDMRDSPLGRCLKSIVLWADADPKTSLAIHEAETRSVGDDEIRSLAWWRLVQRMEDEEARDLAWQHLVRAADSPGSVDASGRASIPPSVGDTSREWIVNDELTELADEGWPFARAAVALVRSHLAQNRGDIDGAVAELDALDAPDSTTLLAIHAARLVSLGRPEDVPVSLVEVLESGASQAVLAQTVWLRGDLRASDAWALASTLPSRYARLRFPDVEIPLLSIVSQVALAVGEVGEARRLADEAVRLARRTDRRKSLFCDVADALCLLAEQGDDAAQARLTELLRARPLEPWPPWPYLSALCPLRALVPEARLLDDFAFGPSFSMAVAAGRIVAEIRDGASVSVAASLPWSNPALLEVHIPPSLRCELALAASGTNADAAAHLDAMAGRDRYLRRLVAHSNPALAAAASDRVSAEPRRPDHDLAIRTLGPLVVERTDAVAIESPTGRVAQLLALLVHEGSMPRQALMARLWPDLAPGAASNNLRVNLHKLLDLIEPDRGSSGSYWIQVHDDLLVLAGDGVSIDRDDFDRHQRLARDAESQGAPSAADGHYAAMRTLHRGRYLDGIDDEGVEPERVRLATLAYAACCRRAELALARGEPEAALEHAVDGESIDPIGERAVRVQILAQQALGARSAVVATADRLRETLAADGLEPEPETRALIDRLQRASTS